MSERGPRRRNLLDLALAVFPEYSRPELHARILCGELGVDGERIRDPKQRVSADARLELLSAGYVSRGGEKLAGAWRAWSFPVAGLIFLDAGASTGGFTHFLLRHGAAAVHAVDVGYNQLDYSLRRDDRVYVHERTNIMSLADLDPRPDAAVGDLSFRSLRGALRHSLELTRQRWGVFLLKPQFELADAPSDFAGVVADLEAVRRVVEETLYDLAAEGIRCTAVVPSVVRGRKGNQEFLIRTELAPNEESEKLRAEAGTLCKRLWSPGRAFSDGTGAEG